MMVNYMIIIKLEQNKKLEPVFYITLQGEEDRNNKLLKRALMESSKQRNKLVYKVPMRFFVPIFSNIDKDKIQLDCNGLYSFLEFADSFEENIYYSTEATPVYMRKWRSEGCPNIYRISVDPQTLLLSKEVVFKKIQPI